MLKYIVASLCGVSLTSSVYLAGWSKQAANPDECEYCVVDTKTVAIDMTGKTDMKNTKCVVMVDDVGDSKNLVEYMGKVYHICCDSCIATFNKDPEKYVKALEAEPEKFGLAKK